MLEEESDSLECMFVEELPADDTFGSKQKVILLLDCQNRDPFKKAGIVHKVPEDVLKKYPVVLFNVPAGNGNRQEALSFGFNGILLTTDSPEDFRKAIPAILSGELWYPRKAVANYILKHSQPVALKNMEECSLSPKEKEILLYLASGATNEDIGDKFLISQHTVRTHIYSIFKKLEVKNRTQAALWVVRNMLIR